MQVSGKSSLDRIVSLETFDAFVQHYKKFVFSESEFETIKDLAKKFVRKVEVGTDSVKIHFIVDQDHYRHEIGLAASAASPSFSTFSGFLKKCGSNTLTVGASGRN